MPRCNCVRSGRHTLDRKSSILTTYRKEWVPENADVRFHPGVLVTFDRNQDFRAREGLLDRGGTVCLSLIPFRVNPGRWVNVVLSRIAVSNSDLLIRLDAENMGHVVASFLIKEYGVCRRGESIIANLRAVGCGSILNVHKSVREFAVLGQSVFCDQVRIGLPADGISRCVDFFGAGGAPLKATTPVTVPSSPLLE